MLKQGGQCPLPLSRPLGYETRALALGVLSIQPLDSDTPAGSPRRRRRSEKSVPSPWRRPAGRGLPAVTTKYALSESPLLEQPADGLALKANSSGEQGPHRVL